MTIDDRELQAIAFLALRVRRATNGAGAWDEPGLIANLRKIQNRNLHMTIEHVLRHAADPSAKTPGVILGSFTPDAPKPGPARPPKKAEECPKHPGSFKGTCSGCRADELAGDDSPPLVRRSMHSDAGAKAARDALNAALNQAATR
jgi:hypothetical protein